MSQENVEIVRRAYDALNRRAYDAWVAFFQSDVEFHGLPENPDARVYRGHDGVREWIKGVCKVLDARFEPEEVTEAGDFVLLSVRASVMPRGSSIRVEQRVFNVVEMKAGKAQRLWGYRTKAEALEAVGLSE